LIKYFTEEGPLAGAPEVHNLNPSIDIRRDITSAKPGMIFLFAHMGIKPGKVDEALPVFEELIKAVEKLEPEFWGCTASADKEKNLIRVVDMFESEKFYDEEHTKSKPILSFHEKIGPYASGDFGLVKLKVVQGYLGR
jgi:quinol monooxygenase YgiN